MTRWWIALLVVLNLVLAAWNLGAFARTGWAPADGREPQRLRQQIHPEAVQILAVNAEASEASEPVAAASAPASAPSAPASSGLPPH